MRCVRCHFETPGDVHFCANCGASLSGTDKPIDFNRTQTLAFSSRTLIDGSLFAGRYLVVEELGKGGMGRVYHALDTKVDEDVALKIINPEIAADAKIIQRFRNELKTTRSITHRNVCRMYDLSEHDKCLFISMEYIPGEDLGDMIRRLGRLPVEKALSIARQVCEGLAEVHRLGVVHRDLKPGNIMIDKAGNAKIMDFGLARTPHGVKLTEVGHVVGTPSFMSPEQINGETVDERSDLFSLGVIMYSMATGELPFKADTVLALALQHKTQHPRHPRALNPHISEGLARIILKCLEIDPAKRYPNAPALLADLDKEGEMFDSYSFEVPRKSGKRATAGPKSFPWTKILAGAAITVALAASGLGVKAFLERSRPDAAHAQVLQEIGRLVREGDLSSAYRLAEQAEQDGRGRDRLAPLWAQISSTLSVRSTPSGAAVWIRDEQAGGPEMKSVGLTPLSDIRVPLSRIRLKVEREGFAPLEDTLSDPGSSVHCLLTEKSAEATSAPARIDEVVQNGDRFSYKINVGSDNAVKSGDQGLVSTGEGGAGERVVARCTVKELAPRRSLIETFDQKEEPRLGYLVHLEKKATAVPGTLVARLDDPGGDRKDFKRVPQSPTMGTLVITSEPSEANVFLDGSSKAAGKTPLTRELRPGKVRMKIDKVGYRSQIDEVDLRAGESSSLFYLLTPQDGAVEVTSDPPGAEVYNGQELLGTTPFERALKPGVYKLRIAWIGKGEQEEVISVNPGEHLPPLRFTFRGARRPSATYFLRVSSDPPGASVTINGVLLQEVTPFVRELDTFKVRLKIEKEGFKPVDEVLSLRPAPDRNEKHFELEKRDSAAAPSDSGPFWPLPFRARYF
jgi:tRNA A-37 threonylcarbamoyl transferase component Bud32